MSKFIRLTAHGAAVSALMLAFAIHTTHAVAAETCVSAPTCADLGYTLTSTANCVGTPLKCPFDKTKYNCTQKSEVTAQMHLNWNAKKALSTTNGAYFYPPKDGIVIGSVKDITNYGSFFTINDTRMSLTGNVENRGNIFSLVKSGDKIRLEGRDIVVWFVPYANN